MNLPEYFISLNQQFDSLTISCPAGTPYFNLGKEITEMISSYLDDSRYFSKKRDTVNQYASLVYAQGWLDAGTYLGIIINTYIQSDYISVTFPDSYNESHLLEKEAKYHSMLTAALKSILVLPLKGSPLYPSGEYCVQIAGDALTEARSFDKNGSIVPALGLLCYGYGWVDTAVRSGLLGIQSNPELFTTEC